MKKITLLGLSLLFTLGALAQETKTTKEVENAFTAKFPKATNVKWDKENATEYEANFINNGIEYSANFSIDGKWLETESPETFENLPVNIQTAFNNSHKGVKIKAVAKIETLNSGIQYEIEVKKGLKTVEYLYNSEGKLIK